MRRATIVGLLVAASAIVGTAKESVSIRVSPRVAFSPADLTIQVTLEPDADNRTLTIVVDSDDFYRASAIQLDGDRTARITTVTFRGVPPGDYGLTAAVIGETGQRKALAHASLTVISSR